MRSDSSDGATSGIEVRGTGGGRGIVSSLGLKVGALILGFLSFFGIPSDEAES